jgi:hypothetical protein
LKGKIDSTLFQISETAKKHDMYQNAMRSTGSILAENAIFLEPNTLVQLSKKKKKGMKNTEKKKRSK